MSEHGEILKCFMGTDYEQERLKTIKWTNGLIWSISRNISSLRRPISRKIWLVFHEHFKINLAHMVSFKEEKEKKKKTESVESCQKYNLASYPTFWKWLIGSGYLMPGHSGNRSRKQENSVILFLKNSLFL